MGFGVLAAVAVVALTSSGPHGVREVTNELHRHWAVNWVGDRDGRPVCSKHGVCRHGNMLLSVKSLVVDRNHHAQEDRQARGLCLIGGQFLISHSRHDPERGRGFARKEGVAWSAKRPIELRQVGGPSLKQTFSWNECGARKYALSWVLPRVGEFEQYAKTDDTPPILQIGTRRDPVRYPGAVAGRKMLLRLVDGFFQPVVLVSTGPRQGDGEPSNYAGSNSSDGRGSIVDKPTGLDKDPRRNIVTGAVFFACILIILAYGCLFGNPANRNAPKKEKDQQR